MFHFKSKRGLTIIKMLIIKNKMLNITRLKIKMTDDLMK